MSRSERLCHLSPSLLKTCSSAHSYQNICSAYIGMLRLYSSISILGRSGGADYLGSFSSSCRGTSSFILAISGFGFPSYTWRDTAGHLSQRSRLEFSLRKLGHSIYRVGGALTYDN